MLDIQKVKQEIKQQTRNGRTTVYLKVSDLQELGFDINSDDERVFIDVSEVESRLPKTKAESFRDSLKFEGHNTHLTHVDSSGFHFKTIEDHTR